MGVSIMTVAELKELPKDQNAPFEMMLVVRSINVRRSKNNTEFLAVELGDRTGSFQVVCFQDHANYLFFSELVDGVVVHCKGQTAYYQSRFSPRLSEVSRVAEEDLSDAMANLVEVSPIPAEQLYSELEAFATGIEHEELRETVKIALDDLGDNFRTTPAAIAMHHAYRHGLIEHTVRMCRAAKALLPLYPEVDGDLALAGIILHDTGKCIEYTGDLATRRSRTGILQGHVVLGYRIVRRAGFMAKLDSGLLERLEHIVLSHQGEPEWGAAVYAATPEAVFVSMVDNLDAKMGMVQHALRTTPEGQEFSERLPGLSAPVLITPTRPETAAEVKDEGGEDSSTVDDTSKEEKAAHAPRKKKKKGGSDDDPQKDPLSDTISLFGEES